MAPVLGLGGFEGGDVRLIVREEILDLIIFLVNLHFVQLNDDVQSPFFINQTSF